MNTVAIVQARMTSTRLPGKVLKQVLDKPLLAYQLDRLAQCEKLDNIVVATTLHSTDDPIVDLCDRLSVDSFRGDENDVLNRYWHCASQFDADVIVRLTADCPLIYPEIVDEVVNAYLGTQCDYCSNTLTRTFPRGMDVEVFARAVLNEANTSAVLAHEREHVTSFIYGHPETYSLCNYADVADHSEYRLTVDTIEDLEVIRTIYSEMHQREHDFTYAELLSFLQSNPAVSRINQHIEQKQLGAS